MFFLYVWGGGGRVGSGGGESGWGVRVDVNEELKFLRKSKKIGGGGGGRGRGGSGLGVTVDVNEELKFSVSKNSKIIQTCMFSEIVRPKRALSTLVLSNRQNTKKSTWSTKRAALSKKVAIQPH